jgi:GAF domain-containing protein
MWNSLRVRLTVIFIGLAIGPLLLVGAILAQRSFASEREQALDLQQQVAQRVGAEIESFLLEVGNDLRGLGGEIRDLEQPDRAQQLSLLLEAFNSGPYRLVYEQFALLDGQGQEQLRVSRTEIIPAAELSNRAGTVEFETAKASRQIYYGGIEFESTSGAPLMTMALPLFEPRSVQLNGVLVAKVRFKTVGDLISTVQVSGNQTIYVVDAEGQVVAHQDASVRLVDKQVDVTGQVNQQLGLEGDEVVLGVAEIHQLGEHSLRIVAERSAGEALASAYNTVYTLVTTIVVALVIAAGLGFLVVRQIVRPIEALSRTAQAISEGDLSQQVKISSRDELGKLAEAFNSMTTQLRDLIDSLEQRVANRTHRLELVAGLSERLTAILNVEELLHELVNQIKDSFGYYHAHIYLLDDKQEKLVVAEGSGEAGAVMKAKGHNIPLDAQTSLVARAARTGEVVRVDNVRSAKDWLPNPLLPDTYSEMAVPIILEGQVVGVLDVQQDKVAGLDEGDANLLLTLANQVAVTIRNARQFAQVQTALVEAHALQQRYIAQSWDRTKVAKKNVGRVQFSLGESTTLNETVIVEARQQALASQEPTLVAFNGSAAEATANPLHALVAPVRLRNVPIGDLQFYDVDPDREWTEGEFGLINAVIDQVAQAAETLRLLDETQERASREQLVSQISNKMRRAPDMESLLKVAVSELSRVLNPARTFVHMDFEEVREPVEKKMDEDSTGVGFDQSAETKSVTT